MNVILEPVTDEVIKFDDNNSFNTLIGFENRNLKFISKLYDLKIDSRGNELHFSGLKGSVNLSIKLVKSFYKIIQKGYVPNLSDFELGSKIISNNSHSIEEIFLDTVCLSTDKGTIAPKSINQKIYIDSIRKSDVVFGIGPAGTGKTYLAVAMAVSYLNLKKVKKIVLTRPAVEAGEKLGFLPGDLSEKVDPYLKPLFDALNDMIDSDRINRMIDKSIIEIAPLAFMRGRTLNDAFIILDEAQNTTTTQMKMFLTRFGFNSKVIVTGDTTQVDLDKNIKSGLVESISLLKNISGIGFVNFNGNDIVRHPLVKEILEAYK